MKYILKYQIFAIILFSLYSNQNFAQELTAEEYVEEVLAYSSSLKSAQNFTDMSYYEYEQQRRNFYPRIDAVATAAYAFRDSYIIEGLDILHLSTKAEVNLTQNIYSGSLVRNRVESAQNQTDIARYSELITEEKIIDAARTLYWSGVAAKKYRDVAQNYVDIIEKTYNLIDIKYRDGLLSKNDLLLMLTRKKEAQFNLTQAEKNYQRSTNNINILRGLTAKKPILFTDTIEVETEVIIPTFVEPEVVMPINKEYRIGKLGVEQSLNQLKINRAQFLPTIAVGVGGNYGTALLNVDNSFTVDGSAFIKVTAPIFGWGMKRQRKYADMSAINRSKNLLTEQEDAIKKSIYDSYTSLSESYEQLQLTRESFAIANESLELSTFSYEEGIISTIELLSAQLSWISAYNAKIGANLSYRISLIGYYRAVSWELGVRSWELGVRSWELGVRS